MKPYYTVSFAEIKQCEYSVESPSKKAALQYAIKRWKKEHKDIPVIACLAYHYTKKLPKITSKFWGTEYCKKVLLSKK